MVPDGTATESPAAVAAVAAAALAAWAAMLWFSHPARGCGAVVAAGCKTGGEDGPAQPARRHSEPSPGHQGLLRLTAVLAVGATAWALVPGGWGLAAAAAAGAVAWRRSRAWEPASSRRRRLRIEAELPWVVDLLTAALRVGLGPVEALERVAEVCHPVVRRELQVPLARLRLGADPVSVWTELAGHPELGRLGVTLRRATESGAPVVEALARLAADLRADRRAAVEVRVRRIEVKAAVPLGVCLLPAFVLLAVVPLVAGSASRLLGG